MQATRRQFLQQSGWALAASAGLTRQVSASPNERVQLAIIGVRGMGFSHLKTFVSLPDAAVVTVCDVDESVLARAGEAVRSATDRDPRKVSDFRQVLDDKSVDAVVVATPHHWHAPIAVRALQAKKDVYLEKPASHVFREGRVILDAARKYGRIVQHGTQMRSSEVTRKAAEVIQSGILGEIKMTKAWNVQKHRHEDPLPDEPVPSGVDYDM